MSNAINVVVDDLLTQTVQIVVSEWYYGRPGWWPLLPSESARDLRSGAGPEVFRELKEEEPLDKGEASLTGPGRLSQFKGIIHVASRSIWGASSEDTIRASVKNAMNIVQQLGFTSVAFPVIGVTRTLTERRAYEILLATLMTIPTTAQVRIIRSPHRHD